MANENMPTMLAAARSSTSYAYNDIAGLPAAPRAPPLFKHAGEPPGAMGASGPSGPRAPALPRFDEEKLEDNMTRRVVQVFIADPNENVPLADCLLYEGDVHVTDLTDQELFFELDVKSMLDKHNVKRITFIDKKVKDRTEHLEAAKVRDLKMVVVTVASL